MDKTYSFWEADEEEDALEQEEDEEIEVAEADEEEDAIEQEEDEEIELVEADEEEEALEPAESNLLYLSTSATFCVAWWHVFPQHRFFLWAPSLLLGKVRRARTGCDTEGKSEKWNFWNCRVCFF